MAVLANLTPLDAGLPDVLRSAGFLFFAFAGYARIATLGEEVVDPEVTIPRAITRALTFVLVVYAIVGVTAVASTPIDVLAGSDAPLKAVVDGSPMGALAPVVDRCRDRLARCAAQPDPRCRPHGAGDGAPQRVARRRWRMSTGAAVIPCEPSWQSSPSCSCWSSRSSCTRRSGCRASPC